jgi:RNA polymerase sigma factor (sigma-70 family)
MTLLVKNRALREAFRRGEKAALTEIYFVYAEALFAMLSSGFTIHSGNKRILFKGYREPWRLEGAVQEIFTRAFAESARLAYDGFRSYKNYLFTIARNYVVDAYRRGGKSFVVMDTVTEETLGLAPEYAPTGAANPERHAVDRQLRAQVSLFVARLDASESALFQHRFTEGLSVERCAALLGRSEYWVKRNEKRLKKQFFLLMKACGFFDGFEYRGAGVSRLLSLLLFNAAGWGCG